MKVVKNMCRLGLVLLVLTSTAAASAEGGLYWAYADAITLYPNEDWHKYPYAYGAAWNFPSLEEAEEAAVEAWSEAGFRSARLPRNQDRQELMLRGHQVRHKLRQTLGYRYAV